MVCLFGVYRAFSCGHYKCRDGVGGWILWLWYLERWNFGLGVTGGYVSIEATGLLVKYTWITKYWRTYESLQSSKRSLSRIRPIFTWPVLNI